MRDRIEDCKQCMKWMKYRLNSWKDRHSKRQN